MTILIHDPFIDTPGLAIDDPAHIPIVGSWLNVGAGGVAAIYQPAGPYSGKAIWYDYYNSPFYTVVMADAANVQFSFVNYATPLNEFIILARLQQSQGAYRNGYGIKLASDGSVNICKYIYNDNTERILATINPGHNLNHTYAIRIIGDLITALEDDVDILHITDTTYSTGVLGFNWVPSMGALEAIGTALGQSIDNPILTSVASGQNKNTVNFTL